MKDLVILGSVILVLCAIGCASGLNCNVGRAEKFTTQPCLGSCFTNYSPKRGNMMGCLPQRMPDGCKTYPNKEKYCFCNTNNCNHIKSDKLFHESWPWRATNTHKLRQDKCQ